MIKFIFVCRHPTSSASAAEIMSVLYFHVMHFSGELGHACTHTDTHVHREREREGESREREERKHHVTLHGYTHM